MGWNTLEGGVMLRELGKLRQWGATHIPTLKWKRMYYSDLRALVAAVREDAAKRVDPVHNHHPAVPCALCMDRANIAAAIRGGK